MGMELIDFKRLQSKNSTLIRFKKLINLRKAL